MKERIIALVSDRRFQIAVAAVVILIAQGLLGGPIPTPTP